MVLIGLPLHQRVSFRPSQVQLLLGLQVHLVLDILVGSSLFEFDIRANGLGDG